MHKRIKNRFHDRVSYFNNFNDKNMSDLGVMNGDERLYFIGISVFSHVENSKFEISFAMAIFTCICANLQQQKKVYIMNHTVH